EGAHAVAPAAGDSMANPPRAPMLSRGAGHRRKCDSMPDAGSVPPPVWPGLAWDAVAAVTARAVRARPGVHLTADDRGFGHRVLRPVAAARGGDTGKDTRAALPVKAPPSPTAASRADGGRQATRPGPRASRATRGPSPALRGCSCCPTPTASPRSVRAGNLGCRASGNGGQGNAAGQPRLQTGELGHAASPVGPADLLLDPAAR